MSICIYRSYIEIFFKAKTAVIYFLCDVLAEVSHVPRFIHIACLCLFILRVSQDEAVFPAVCRYPLTLFCLTEGLIERVKVECEACLVLRISGTGRISVRLSLTVTGSIVII